MNRPTTTLMVATALISTLAGPLTANSAWSDDQSASDWSVNDEQAKQAYARGDLSTAKLKWEAALKIADKAGQVEPGVVNCLCSLALVSDKNGQKAEAERLYELAMRDMEALAGPNSPRFAEWMPDLALLYEAHHRPDKAEVLYKRVLSIRERSYGADDPSVADILQKYARFLKRQKRLPEAEQLEDRVKAIEGKQSDQSSQSAPAAPSAQ